MSVSSTSLIERIYNEFSGGVHFATPIPSSQTSELNLVKSVLRILQGCSSSLLYWDEKEQRFVAKVGLFVNHLSQRSLGVVLNQFVYAATCLKLVENVISKAECSHNGRVVAAPTLRAFCCSVSSWLKRLRGMALKEEERLNDSSVATMPTLMGLANSLSSLCSGSEYLLQLVDGAIPKVFLDPGSSVSAAEISAFILDYLFKKLNDICLIQGGEEEPYLMVLYLFVGSLLPYIEVLDSWLYEGTLDDPFAEMFFYANESISIDEADFWEKSYLQRSVTYHKSSTSVTDPAVLINDKKEMAGRQYVPVSSTTKGKEQTYKDPQVCPLFLKDIAHSIVSAGKSLQLIQHVHTLFQISHLRAKHHETGGSGSPKKYRELKKIDSSLPIARLTLSEVFCVSLSGLIGHGDHISEYFCQSESCDSKIVFSFESHLTKQKLVRGDDESLSALTCSERIWFKFLVDMLLQKSSIESENKSKDVAVEAGMTHCVVDESLLFRSFYSENPAITVCQSSLSKNKNAWNSLNLSKNFFLPPLNDQVLREAIFGGGCGTNYAMGFQFAESDYRRTREDSKLLAVLLPYPTILPSSEVDSRLSELLPFQNNSTLPSRVLEWIQTVKPKVNPLPGVIMQACLNVYIRKQVDCVGKRILLKLMNDWRLMDELGVLRAIYLLGSGDLLQHFLTVIFDRLDKGESWDDDFELNTILQESIRNSADGGLLSAPESLVVSISRSSSISVDNDDQIGAANLVSMTRKSRFGIDGLDLLNFTYKVPWPLELIANTEAIKKYNQVMRFLLKVKRAKYVLDKTRRWMWKARGAAAIHRKRHWLVEQKLLHFVDAFHQYVMDRVYHSAWLELCDGMAAAGSLDEVIEVHEAYLLSIQRQCFAVPDKLGALIASRINSILGLALDFHTVQQTLSSGGPVSAIKARCEMEVESIEKQFDDCIAFLLRVLSFKLNVGHFPHLADLVTRINYNFFYMSGSGNLITAPGSESVTSRLGKTFPVRGD